MWRAKGTKIEDTGTKIDEYRSQIASGKTIPFSKIIDLHNQLLKTEAAVPPDLEEHGLLQIFQDEKLRTLSMAQRLADLMTNQCKSLPDDLRQYLGPISTPAPTIIAPSEVVPSPALRRRLREKHRTPMISRLWRWRTREKIFGLIRISKR